MTVRIWSPVYLCECDSAMVFLDDVDGVPRRRMVCGNSKCNHYGTVVDEPVFPVFSVPPSAEQNFLMKAELLRKIEALRDAVNRIGPHRL